MGETTYQLKKIILSTKHCDYDLIMYGDSITEPEQYWSEKDFANAWTQLVIAEIERRGGKAVSSGWSGKTINHLLNWIKYDLPIVHSKYVMVTIGTNGKVILLKTF